MYTTVDIDPTPTREPSDIRQGDTTKWLIHLPAYPASDGWTLTYYFLGNGVKQTQAATVDVDGDDYDITLPAALTSALVVGEVAWQAKAAKATTKEVYTVRYGTMQVHPDLAVVGANYDPRSDARQMLDAVNDLIKTLANNPSESKTINGVAYNQKKLGDLFTLKRRLEEDVFNEENKARIKAGLGGRRTVYTRFQRPQ